jgi:hypothetical protein
MEVTTMPKKQKLDRNLFLMKIAPERCQALMRAALSERSMRLSGVDDFEGAMDAICLLFTYAYSAGMSDAIDALVDGRELTPIGK